MSHLGDRVTDLVDGQLGPEATERAHAHLARCTACREAVEAERLMKSRLASLPGPPPSDDLTSRLLAIGGGPGPGSAPVVRSASAPPLPSASSRPAGSRPTGSRPAGRGDRVGSRPGARVRPVGRRRLAAAVLGALSVVGVGATGLTFSATALVPGSVVPAVATFVVEQTAQTRDVPWVDMPTGWMTGDDRQDGRAATP